VSLGEHWGGSAVYSKLVTKFGTKSLSITNSQIKFHSREISKNNCSSNYIMQSAI